MIERENEGAGDILDVHEIAPLLPVLEDQRRLAVEKPRREDRQHTGIGIR